MTKQLLFYGKAVPVMESRHADYAVNRGDHFDFAAAVNAVPVVVSEFAKLSREYPIAFTESGGQYQPVALCGLRDNENLFVNNEGHWAADYIPAFVRRYPFVFHKKDGDEFVLCIDEGYEGLNQSGEGHKLFENGSEPSEYLKKMLGFTTSYQKDVQTTAAFSESLKAHDIVRPAQISFPMPDGQQAATRGLHMVDRELLENLPGDVLEAMAKSGELAHVYAHMLSLQNVDLLGAKLRSRMSH